MFSLEFCYIFLKISKFNWSTSLPVFKVFVISYHLKWLSRNQFVSWLLAVYAYGDALQHPWN